MGAAHLLGGNHRVTLFEAGKKIGGHARTVLAGKNGNQPVDTGFIVHNRKTYPNFIKFIAELGIKAAETSMSFSYSCRNNVQ